MGAGIDSWWPRVRARDAGAEAFEDLGIEGFDTRFLVVDLVVHEHGPQGPACRWALGARPGDVVQVVAPHRANREYGGTEFAPDDRHELLLVADETVLPALARIVADVAPGVSGHAFVEVPSREDVLPLDVPDTIEVTWVVRDGAEHGRRLVEVVRGFLGLGALDPTVLPAEAPSDLDGELWETPRYSSSGEDVGAQPQTRARTSNLEGLYTWIAGESWLVKALRRSLVRELHVDRTQGRSDDAPSDRTMCGGRRTSGVGPTIIRHKAPLTRPVPWLRPRRRAQHRRRVRSTPHPAWPWPRLACRSASRPGSATCPCGP